MIAKLERTQSNAQQNKDKHKLRWVQPNLTLTKIVSEYDQEIPQSQTADNPIAPRGRATQPSRDTRKTKLSKATSSLFPIKIIAILEWT